MVSPPFQAEIINVGDQFVQNGQVIIDSVTTSQSGFVVVHSGNADSFGGTIGQAPVQAGTTTQVAVPIAADQSTAVLWPMLHSDTGVVGTYEFGTVEGADPPVIVGTTMATVPIWTVPHIRMFDQASLPGDGQPAHATAYTVRVASVLSEGPGFIVIHQEQDGTFGPVAGFLAVPAGLSKDLFVELNPERVTYHLWPMLHVDTGVVGTYEFGQVEGADPPVVFNDQVLTFPILAGPGLVLVDQTPEAGSAAGRVVVSVAEAVIDRPGWIAVHSNDNGNPGPVLGVAPVHTGLNQNVGIEVDEAGAGNLVFPMLHYDTGTAGVYEFGQVEGADPPVIVGGNLIVAPLNLGSGGQAAAPDVCSISSTNNVNLRSSPSTDGQQLGTLNAGQTATVTGQTTGADGYIWYQLEGGSFVRSDVVTTSGVCGDLPAAGAAPMDHSTAPTPTPDTAAPAVPTATTAPAAGGGEVVVEIQDFQFAPQTVTVAPGTTVRWVHTGQVQHTVTSDTGLFDSDILAGGQEFSFTFNEAGTFPYFCELHGVAGGGGMAGSVIVQ
jgi:plastocyanin